MITTAAAPAQVGVVIVSWNVRDLLARCLESLRGSSLPLDVVVVDNASADGSADMVASRFPAVHLIRSPRNLGFTGGNNVGLRALGVLPADGAAAAEGKPSPVSERAHWREEHSENQTPEYVLLLNPDAELAGDAVAALVADLHAHPDAAVAGPLLVYPDGRIQSSRRRFPTLAVGLIESAPVEWHWRRNPVSRDYRMEEETFSREHPPPAGFVDWVTGAAMLFRSAALASVGGFDEGYFMYAEELDLCRRLAEAGWRTRFTPAAVVVHHEGQSSDQAVAARHLRFAESRVRYFAKHHGPVQAMVVRGGVVASYLVETGIEAAKWLIGHKRDLRQARVAMYLQVVRGLCYRTRPR